MKKAAAILGLCFAAALLTTPAVPSAHWLLEYQGAHNNVGSDGRFLPFVSSALSQQQNVWLSSKARMQSLAGMIQTYLGRPIRTQVTEGRYWSEIGCMPGSCNDLGLLWADTGSPLPLVLFAASTLVPVEAGAPMSAARYGLLLFGSEAEPPTLESVPATARESILALVRVVEAEGASRRPVEEVVSTGRTGRTLVQARQASGLNVIPIRAQGML